MTYRKFKADKIFDGYNLLNDHVLITTDEGIIESVLPAHDSGDDVEVLQGILTPGFINCHCHLELSHMKGLIPEQTGLVDFVFKVVTERHFSESEILSAIESAEEEMIQNGIVAVGDICNNTLTIPQKQKNRIAYYNFIEASGWLPSGASIRFERTKEIYEQFRHQAVSKKLQENIPQTSICHPEAKLRDQTRNSIVPHAPYSVSQHLWQLIQPYFENKVVSIHNQETIYEDEFFLHGTGDFQRMYQLMKIDNTHHEPTKRSSLQSYYDKLEKASNKILVHNTFIREEDIEYVKKNATSLKLQAASKESKNNGGQPQTPNPKLQTFFCLCPNANQYIENVLPPVDLLRKNNCTIVLGTDSLASNKCLDILDEINTIRKKFTTIPIEECLHWATINGAMALEMDDVLGSFEKGKKPGVNLIDQDLNSVKIIF